MENLIVIILLVLIPYGGYKLFQKTCHHVGNGDIDNIANFMDEYTDKPTTETSITLKNPVLDVDKITDYKPEKEVAKFIYRPDTLDKYIGQTEAKETFKTALKIIKQLRPVHMLVNGWPGTGKSTLIFLLQKILKAHLIYRIPEQISNPDSLIAVLNEINATEGLSIFFLTQWSQ